MTALVIRPLIAGEEAAFGDTYTAMAAAGEYRPEWTWVALRDGVVVARAAWWAGPKDDKPLALDSPPASGCPVYTKRSTGEAIAKGIISGGSAITSGDCWLNFTDTYLAEKALPGIIKHT
ncbi:hypothetical protein [Phytohabitans rumicis]|uniref:hypothetical protein n=1 Tax=Phytohabitans rumicis TaxID=1076125 RepID=UPI0031F0063B